MDTLRVFGLVGNAIVARIVDGVFDEQLPGQIVLAVATSVFGDLMSKVLQRDAVCSKRNIWCKLLKVGKWVNDNRFLCCCDYTFKVPLPSLG